MIVNFVYNDKLSSIILPNKISGQFWFSDSRDCNVVRIEGVNNKWMIKTQSQYAVRVKNVVTGNNTDITSDEIVSKRLYQIKNLNSIKDRIYLFTEEYTEDRIEFYLSRLQLVMEKYRKLLHMTMNMFQLIMLLYSIQMDSGNYKMMIVKTELL